jgi:hypothetical protein
LAIDCSFQTGRKTTGPAGQLSRGPLAIGTKKNRKFAGIWPSTVPSKRGEKQPGQRAKYRVGHGPSTITEWDDRYRASGPLIVAGQRAKPHPDLLSRLFYSVLFYLVSLHSLSGQRAKSRAGHWPSTVLLEWDEN